MLKPIAANLITMFCLNYMGILQVALTFENGGAFLRATWAIVPVGIIVFLVLSRNLGLVRYAQKLEAKKAGEPKGVELADRAKDASGKEKAN